MNRFSPLQHSCCLLSILIASWAAQRPALAQSAAERPAASAKARADAVSTPDRTRVWTCPLHPQIHEAKSGSCPICNLELAPIDEKAVAKAPHSQLMDLDDMLAIALKRNPNVRAAQARVKAAEAELDRVRFDVLQQITEFRERWQKKQGVLRASVRELRAAEAAAERVEAAENADQGARQRARELLAAARERHVLLRDEFAAVEAALPLLLGQGPEAAPAPDAASRKLIREDILPKARQLLELRTREYASGTASILELTAAHREFAKFKAQLATTNQEKVAAVESQKALLQKARAVVGRRYKTGQAPQGDVLAIELQLLKLELWLLDLKKETADGR